MKHFTSFFILIFSQLALAQAEHGAHAGGGHDEIPAKLITYQTINVVLMIFGLVYFLKEPVKKFFLEKRSHYLSAAKKAEAARKAAEEERMEIQVRLSKLESTADESIAKARSEAADMKRQLVAEAESLSKRIREEAEISSKLEVEKAKNQLRQTLINESLQLAKNQLSSKVTEDDHKRLESDFISNIQGAPR